MDITLKTLTPLWTGGVDGTMDRLHETGLIGSLRWWYEVIVRGLGGYACDPTGDNHCEYDPQKPAPPEKQLCAACYLFGCTGWQRKFKLIILDESRNLFSIQPKKDGLAENIMMVWQFIQLRPIDDEEKWLLYQAVHIASNYGVIGGRTPRKPQGNKKVGGDSGLFTIENESGIPQEIDKERVMKWLKIGQFRRVTHEEWPDLRWFFFIQKQHLKRKKINELLGLSEDGKKQISHNGFQKALRGKIGVSKKIFSFEKPPGRMWGYLPNQILRERTISYLRENLGIQAENIKNGQEVLHEL